MSANFGPKLPLSLDPTDGVLSLRTRKDAIKQELRDLVLTNPGERVLHPGSYGVGINKLLFEKNDDTVLGEFASKLRQQVSRWMPYLRILEVGNHPIESANAIFFFVRYLIEPLGVQDVLNLEAEDLR